MKTPSKKAVDAAYNTQPYNDLLYGDVTRPCNKEEVANMLKAAYAVDFNGVGKEIRNGQIIHYDEFGTEYVLDEAGNKMPPFITNKIENHVSGFTIYDTTQGHCGLCGKLTCKGQCFK
jgi:hypothetical protein